MSDDLVVEFRRLCDKAIVASDTLDSTEDFEPDFINVLEFIREHPSIESDIKQVFIDMLGRKDGVPYELLSFCMHELRWVEIKDAAEQRFNSESSPRVLAVMENIIDSFSEGWSSKITYPYFD